MLKNACTLADFSFFILHFSFNVVPLHPISENPMHSTTTTPVIEAQSRPKDVINNTLINHKQMYLDSAKKQEIFGKYGTSNTDTGSAESQIALFSYRIAHLTEHLKKNHKDHVTQRSLTILVGKRRRLLDYLYKRDINRYRAIIKALGLRR